jgi:arylformamidase
MLIFGGHDLAVRRGLLVLLVGVLLASLASCGSDGVGIDDTGDAAASGDEGCEPGEVVPARSERDVAYAEVDGVDPNLLSLDLDVPEHDACEPPPLVVFVHGGGWRVGDKTGAAIEGKRQLFDEAGWAFASVNYRLSPEPHDLADPDRVTYPTHPQDVADALAFLDVEADELGIDTSRIGLVGHSAGAGIVSTLGTDASFLDAAGVDPAQLVCTVSLDTEAYDVAAGAEDPGMVGRTYQNAFTTDPAVWDEASPLNHVDGDEAPFLVVTRGQPERTALAGRFVDELDAAGADAELLDVSPYAHDDTVRLLGAPGETTLTEPVVSFFEGCLADPGTSTSDG